MTLTHFVLSFNWPSLASVPRESRYDQPYLGLWPDKYKQFPANPPTVDWDHETRELSGESVFFKFVDEHLIQIKEE